MEEFVLFYPENHKLHHEPGHPERPERLESIKNYLSQAHVWDSTPKVEPVELMPELLERVHNRAYLEWLENACREGTSIDMDTYTTPASWKIALATAGGAAGMAEKIWDGQAKMGFAFTRPPGHHATNESGMGFCLLNNIAIAAEKLVLDHGAKRIAIVDLDLHHGNGTQNIFWRRGDVLYISTHQYPYYPGTGSLAETGAGEGKGTTINLPLPAETGDEGFKEIMNGIILPCLERYQPEILLVSIGFDGHWKDPLGNLLLSSAGYYFLINTLADWAGSHCDGKIALFLEGGYDLEAISVSSLAAIQALKREEYHDPLGPSPRPANKLWMHTLQEARKTWQL